MTLSSYQLTNVFSRSIKSKRVRIDKQRRVGIYFYQHKTYDVKLIEIILLSGRKKNTIFLSNIRGLATFIFCERIKWDAT